MTKKITPHYAGNKGAIIDPPNEGILFARGNTVPADAAAGYGTGCLFLQLDGGVGTALYVNEGTILSADFNPVALPGTSLLALTATATELNRLDDTFAVLSAGDGITSGTGTVYKTSVFQVGGIITTRILLDLTGLHSKNTDGDIIGEGSAAAAAHLGQITAARNGTILGGIMRCLEVPTGGDPNIALYSATEATGKYDDAISGLTETIIFDPAADWTIDMSRSITTPPAADEYLYLVQGDAAGTDAAYTAGKYLIELFGY